MFVLWVLCVVR